MNVRGIVAGLAVVAATTTSPAHAASTDLPWKGTTCASGWEQKQLDVGMTRAYVEALLDGPGRVGSKPTERVYRPCNRSWRRAQVFVQYDRHDRVWNSFKVYVPTGGLKVPERA